MSEGIKRPPLMIDKKAAANYLGISVRGLQRIVAAGLIRVTRPSPNVVRFSTIELRRYARSVTAAEPQQSPSPAVRLDGEPHGRA